MQIIELYSDPDYYVNVVLDGVVFYFHLSWNSEAKFWTLSIENSDRDLLVAFKLLPNRRLLERYHVAGMPAGDLAVVSSSNTIAKNDFADGYARLVYASESEL